MPLHIPPGRDFIAQFSPAPGARPRSAGILALAHDGIQDRTVDIMSGDKPARPPVGRQGLFWSGCILFCGVIPLPAANQSIPAAAAPQPAHEVAVYRTMMPECGPSAFAVALGPDLGFSFDPGRGGVNYIWRGDFVDLEPTWRAKINQPAEVRGTILYREHGRYPLRLGSPEREPTFEFKGYVLQRDAVEFQYLLDGVLVQEEIRATPGGRGLVRRFRLGAAVERWTYALEPQPAAEISSAEGIWNEGRTALIGPRGREFSIRVDLPVRQP